MRGPARPVELLLVHRPRYDDWTFPKGKPDPGEDLVATAVREAKRAEHNYRHSAIIHTKDVDHMTYMAKELDTTIFVKNGPSVAGLGLGGEGYLSYSIATTTGEGITTPKTFTRVRRCVLVENLRII